ncbi:MAG: methionyl-tRNA formyltransferase [Prevotella sp.]|nr:methionyl-tRNA formyltransferase [Prevotella sp.]MDD7047043.1 methionyl-tRNA formyltransferase [Prevotella sp.]
MKKEDLKIVFMGTPEFAVETLKALVENNYNVVGVVTQPDKPVGRHGSVLHQSEVKQYALNHGLPVLQPVKMKDPVFLEQLEAWGANLQVVVAFRMLPEVVWGMPQYGTFNVHAALLPKYRGAAPINWAVINGETETGVTTFFLDHDIDTGRIIMNERMNVPDDANVEYVYDRLMHLGADICLKTIEKIIEGDGTAPSIPQEESDNLPVAPKIFKETCRIDWNQTAKRVYDFVRGLSPYPGAWTTIEGEGMKPAVLKIFKTTKTRKDIANASTGDILTENGRMWMAAADQWLQIEELQLAGKKRMDARSFVNGLHATGLRICPTQD